MLFFGVFAWGGSTKQVLAQLTLPQRGFVSQAVGLEEAPPSVFYGHHFIEVRCFGSGKASSTGRYHPKGHFCEQFVTKFNDTECMIGNPGEAG